MTASPLTRGQGQPCPSDPGIPVSPFCPVRGSLSRVQKNAGVFFSCSKTTARAESPSPRCGRLCGNLGLGHSSGKKNVHVGDRWSPPRAAAQRAQRAEPEPQAGRAAVGPGAWGRRRGRWGPGPRDGDGAGAGPACSGPGGGAVSWARERAAGKAGHDGEVRGVGEPREDAPSPPGSARSAWGTSSQFTLCRSNTETQTSGSQHDRRLSFALSGPSEGLPSRAPPAGTQGPGSTGCGELAPAPTASDRK